MFLIAIVMENLLDYFMTCRQTIESIYSISLRKPKEGEDPNRAPTDIEILNAYGGMHVLCTTWYMVSVSACFIYRVTECLIRVWYLDL